MEALILPLPCLWWERLLQRYGKLVHITVERVRIVHRYIKIEQDNGMRSFTEYVKDHLHSKYNVHYHYALCNVVKLPGTWSRVTIGKLLTKEEVLALDLPKGVQITSAFFL